jgi:hypothetical protein
MGTIHSHRRGPEHEGDRLSFNEADGQGGEVSDDGKTRLGPKSYTPRVSPTSSHPRVDDLTLTPSSTAASLPPTQQGRYFLLPISNCHRHRDLNPQSQLTSTSSCRSSLPTPLQEKKKGRKSLGRGAHGQTSGDSEFEADNGITGIVTLEVHGATDLPRDSETVSCLNPSQRTAC